MKGVRSDCLSKILYRNGAERGSYFFARILRSSTPAAPSPGADGFFVIPRHDSAAVTFRA
jgi:hypothetical protein